MPQPVSRTLNRSRPAAFGRGTVGVNAQRQYAAAFHGIQCVKADIQQRLRHSVGVEHCLRQVVRRGEPQVYVFARGIPAG